jgi:hypothetical protein
MMDRAGGVKELKITDVCFNAAPPEDVEGGLLGWVNFTLNSSLRVGGIAVRRTLDGRHVLSFPMRKDRKGRACFLLRPLNDVSRREVEGRVLGALGLEVAQ